MEVKPFPHLYPSKLTDVFLVTLSLLQPITIKPLAE
jgi:hypothetical protein